MDNFIKICMGNKCCDRGATRIFDKLKSDFGEEAIETTGCMGYCENGPNVIHNDKIFQNCRTSEITDKIKSGDGIDIKKLEFEDLGLNDDML